MATRVLFRAEKSGEFKGVVTAVFPDSREHDGTFCCFAHVGQHSSCSKEWYHKTHAATPKEYADLKRELESAPYNYRLHVIKRWPHNIR